MKARLAASASTPHVSNSFDNRFNYLLILTPFQVEIQEGLLSMLSFLSVRKLSLALVVLTIPALAQSGLGVVTGTVQDPSKASVPKAAVALMNTVTGLARDSTSNDAGQYYLGSMPVGGSVAIFKKLAGAGSARHPFLFL